MKTVKTQRSVVNENVFCFGDKWVELPKLEIAFHLKNLQTRYDTDSSVGCKERVAASYECNRHLDRTGRLEFERCSELCRGFEEMAIKLDKPKPSAIGQQSLITIGKCRIARPLRYDQKFNQTQARCLCQEIAAIDRFEQRLYKRKVPALLLDKVDKIKVDRPDNADCGLR